MEDNLACHKRAGVRAAVERTGAEVRLLPAYSPDLNPIERAFSKLKARRRAVREVEDVFGELADAFDPAERRNYFRSCGHPNATPS